jgi:hypothetical protein
MVMTCRRRSTLPGAFALLAACACGPDITRAPSDAKATRSTLAVAPSDTTARGVIRATIISDRLVRVSPDTACADSVKVPEHLAGAQVAVYREIRDSTAATGLTSVSDTEIGRLVSDSAGVVLLTNVPKGYYRLNVSPPAGSPYQSASAGMESLTSADIYAVFVELHSK